MTPALFVVLALGLAADAPPPLDTGRVYGLDVTVATATTVPVIGETKVYTRSLLLVDFELRGGQLIQRQRLCAVEVDDDARLSDTVIPPAFIAHFPQQEYVVRLELGDGAWRYVADPGPVAVGYDQGVVPVGLPQELDSPGVVDWDQDGVPGATVKLVVPVLGDIDIYIAQLGHTLMVGEVQGGEISGQVQMQSFSQRTLGASNRLFHTSPATRFVPERSQFRLAPLDAGASCASLVAAWGRSG